MGRLTISSLRRTLMRLLSKHTFFIAIGLVLVMVVSACGSTTSTGSTSSTPTATPTTASTSTVQTAQVTVNGKTTTILTDTQGKTLYYFTPDTAAKVAWLRPGPRCSSPAQVRLSAPLPSLEC